MKKNKNLIKIILVSVIVAVLGYLGLDIPRDYIEEVVEEQLDTSIQEKTSIPVDDDFYEVVSVIDGDTFKVLKDGTISTVRLIGIDTPETKYSDRGEECYGEEASREAVRLLEGSMVSLTSDSTQDAEDKYGRLLAYAMMKDGQDFGEVMIRNGFAEEYTFSNSYQNQKIYKDAEALAREERIGLWSCD